MIKRKADYISPPQTMLNIPLAEFKKVIEERMSVGENILQKKITTQTDFEAIKDEYNIWDDYNSEFLKQSFSNENNEYKDSYDNCSMFIGFAARPKTPKDKLDNFKDNVNVKLSNLKKLLTKADLLKNAIEFSEGKLPLKMEKKTNNIFIVHGHDERTKLDVERTIEKLGLIPIILSNQPNQGQTIIEKFELHSNVEFAIVILTADDLGKAKTEIEEKYRARQNVILEMGYFIGKLGRNKVFPLYESGVELPSDLHGILYNLLDATGGWKFKLAKELNAAGYVVDANKLL